MTFGTGFALYFLFWWLSLFIVLPFGARSQAEDGNIVPGTEPGAPTKVNIWMKFLTTSILAGVLFAIYLFITIKLGYSLDKLPVFFPG